jgi:DNA-binding transcriptional LysR family regulator
MAVRISHFSSLGAMTGLVRSGFGVALLPLAVVAGDIAQGTLVAIDVVPAPTSLPLVASQRGEQASPLADALLSIAQQVSDQYLASRPELRAD